MRPQEGKPMHPSAQNEIHAPSLTRGSFLRGTIKLFALSSVSFTGSECSAPVSLRGISAQEYANIRAVGEVFLTGNPVPNFDLGKALDDYVYGHPSPIDTKDLVHDLAKMPSSLLASVVLDGSFTTLVDLTKEEREKRMLGWRDSGDGVKRGLFNVLRQTSFFLLSSSPALLEFAGYSISGSLKPYR